MERMGFIGTGNMGFPMLKGAIKEFGLENITYTAASIDEMKSVKTRTGADYADSNADLIRSCGFIVLCVKPQFMGPVFEALKKADLSGKLIISIVAGMSIEDIRLLTGQPVRVVRAMPNTPAMVGEGMSCISYSDDTFEEKIEDGEKEIVRRLFGSFGRFVEMRENLINAAMCANGCSPAYVYMFIEALADGAVRYGIDRKTAYELVAQTVLGSARMVLETGEHPGKLKDNVCSPGGTTIAAVAALEEAGFRNALIKATDACYKRASELAG